MKPLSSYLIYRNMSNFKKAITEKKQATVGFVGGSITDPRGRQRWPEYVMNELVAAYPDVAFTVVNIAIGATGSAGAVMRCESRLIPYDCDLIFMEYAVNDTGIPTDERSASREGLIRKFLNQTKADLVITYTYCIDFLPDMLEGKLPDSIAEYEVLAEHYGISSVFMSSYALDCTKAGTLRWEEWLPDGLHPANTGSRFYAAPVVELLKKAVADENPTGLCRTTASLFADNWERAELYPLNKVNRKGPWMMKHMMDLTEVDFVLATSAVGAKANFDFTGTGLVIITNFGWLAADYRYRIDGGEWKEMRYPRPDWISDLGWTKEITLEKNLENREHTFELETLPPLPGGKHKGTIFEICNIGILKD